MGFQFSAFAVLERSDVSTFPAHFLIKFRSFLLEIFPVLLQRVEMIPHLFRYQQLGGLDAGKYQ